MRSLPIVARERRKHTGPAAPAPDTVANEWRTQISPGYHRRRSRNSNSNSNCHSHRGSCFPKSFILQGGFFDTFILYETKTTIPKCQTYIFRFNGETMMKLPIQFNGIMRNSLPSSFYSVRTMKSIKANQLTNSRSNVIRKPEFGLKLPQSNTNFPIGPFDIIAGDTCICVCIGDSCICNEECG